MFKRVLLPATVPLLAIAILATASGFAQEAKPQYGFRQFHALDLSEEQQAQLEAITTETMKEHLPIRSKLQTLKAELDELLIADNPNQGAINRKIDEMSGLRTEMQKARIDTRLRIRALLTEEQRVKFDTMGMRGHRGPGRRMMMNKGRTGRMGGMRGGRSGMRRGHRFGDTGGGASVPEEVEVAEF